MRSARTAVEQAEQQCNTHDLHDLKQRILELQQEVEHPLKGEYAILLRDSTGATIVRTSDGLRQDSTVSEVWSLMQSAVGALTQQQRAAREQQSVQARLDALRCSDLAHVSGAAAQCRQQLSATAAQPTAAAPAAPPPPQAEAAPAPAADHSVPLAVEAPAATAATQQVPGPAQPAVANAAAPVDGLPQCRLIRGCHDLPVGSVQQLELADPATRNVVTGTMHLMIQARRGEGGFSSVYSCRQLLPDGQEGDERMVLKVLKDAAGRPHITSAEGLASAHSEQVVRACIEARVMRHLQASPHVVRYLGFGYLQGETVYAWGTAADAAQHTQVTRAPCVLLGACLKSAQDMLRDFGRFSVAEAKGALRAVASGLRDMHQLKVGKLDSIIHRDLTAANVLLDFSFNFVLADFGLSKTMLSRDEASRTRAGVPHFHPPELVAGGTYNASVDVWQLGCLALRRSAGPGS